MMFHGFFYSQKAKMNFRFVEPQKRGDKAFLHVININVSGSVSEKSRRTSFWMKDFTKRDNACEMQRRRCQWLTVAADG